jgi:hypothetical protein
MAQESIYFDRMDGSPKKSQKNCLSRLSGTIPAHAETVQTALKAARIGDGALSMGERRDASVTQKFQTVE